MGSGSVPQWGPRAKPLVGVWGQSRHPDIDDTVKICYFHGFKIHARLYESV